jgi:serine/threonine protein kinase
VDRLGVGGFASVWLYRDDELESDVAVKALADNWAQRLDIRDRFLQEARILRRADSDHVVRVYDVGEVDGTPYFVMTYADLGTVADLLAREHRLPLDRTLDLVTQAGAGLAVLHVHGSIHRDIKPANLLLRSDGDGVRVMVADLGVAKAMLHASGLTHVVGTPAYMAPEQAIGLGVDERADVYALAAVTYQLLTGRVAHTGTISDLATLQPPPPPTELADLPPAIDDIVLMGLAPDPDDRWPTIRAYVNALQTLAPSADRTWLVSPPEPVRHPSGSTDAPAPSSGSRLLLVLVCVAVFLACFGGALVATQQLH